MRAMSSTVAILFKGLECRHDADPYSMARVSAFRKPFLKQFPK